MNDEQIQEVEVTIGQLKEAVACGQALERLKKNRDFKKLITEGYTRDEAVRLAHISNGVNIPEGGSALNAEAKAAVYQDLQGIASFVQYVTNIARGAQLALEALEDHEDLLTDLQGQAGAEDGDEG